MRILSFLALLFFVILLSMSTHAQNDNVPYRHAAIMQFGGETMASLNYEYSIMMRKHFLVNANIGFGLNKTANSQIPDDTAIYGIHSGVILLTGVYPFYFELGINPTTYFYRSMTFVNLNSWVGLRYYTKKLERLFFSAGYTPRLYTSFTDVNHSFFNAFVGAKIGFRF